jgi:hypothetical protein
MNRLPFATALISVAVAVALWLIASMLEGDAPWLTPSPDSAPGRNRPGKTGHTGAGQSRQCRL